MYSSGRGRGRGRPSSPDMGFCAVHQKRRNRGDLMPMGGSHGSLQCRPGKECRGGDNVPTAVCHIHHRKRSVTQMREIRRGVWECLRDSQCRLQGDPPAPRGSGGGGMSRPGRGRSPQRRQGNIRGRGGSGGAGGRGSSGRGRGGGHSGQGFTPLRSFSGGSNRRGQQRRGDRGDRGGADDHRSWNPQSSVNAMLGANVAQSRQQRQAASRREGRAAWSLTKVWCALHGKQLPIRDTEKREECCYVCRDATECVSSPLPVPAELRKSGCKEVLCAQHETLRSVGFVEINKEKTGYQCLAVHPCRHATLGRPTTLAPDAYAGASGVPAVADGYGEGQEGLYQGGVNASAGSRAAAARSYARPNAPEAASSFFA